MSTLVIMMGVPGAGKSTSVLEHYLEDWSFELVSTDCFVELDALEKGITYSEAFPNSIKTAEKRAWAKAGKCRDNGISVVWDQTNLSVKKRNKIFNFFPDSYKKMLHVVHASREVIMERHKTRKLIGDKVIPDEVIENMLLNFNIPSQEEISKYDRVLMEIGNV